MQTWPACRPGEATIAHDPPRDHSRPARLSRPDGPLAQQGAPRQPGQARLQPVALHRAHGRPDGWTLVRPGQPAGRGGAALGAVLRSTGCRASSRPPPRNFGPSSRHAPRRTRSRPSRCAPRPSSQRQVAVCASGRSRSRMCWPKGPTRPSSRTKRAVGQHLPATADRRCTPSHGKAPPIGGAVISRLRVSLVGLMQNRPETRIKPTCLAERVSASYHERISTVVIE